VKTGRNIDEVIVMCEDEKVKKMLESQDVDFDGLVMKVEDLAQREIV
jgi:hypothetical protein